MSADVDLGPVTAFPPDSKTRREVDGKHVVVVALDNGLVVIENRCPHQLAELFHEGVLANGTITCPMHGKTFRLDDGRCVNDAGRLTILESRTVEGRLQVKPVPGPSYGLF